MSRLVSVLLVVVMITSSAFFTGCVKKSGGADASDAGNTANKKKLMSESDFNNPTYSKEQEGASLVTKPHDESDFVGTWVAPSDYAEYLFGNVTLKIYQSRTWSGVITDEKFNGTWRPDDKGITIEDTQGLIKWNLFFVDDGTLMFSDTDNPEISIVLMPSSN